MDSFEDFEFKPLTEGLGFNKKAETLKTTSAPAAPAPSRSSIFPPTPKASEPAPRSTFDSAASRSAFDPSGSRAQSSGLNAGQNSNLNQSDAATSQSISELMASLPPSLDFLDDKQDLTRKSERPQIYQPIAREEYRAPSSVVSGGLSGVSAGATASGSSSGAGATASGASSGPTMGSVLPAPGTKAGGARGGRSASAAVIAAPLNSGTFGSANIGTLSPRAPAQPSSMGRVAPVGYRERMTEAFTKAFPRDNETQEKIDASVEDLRPTTVSFSASLIDGMVVAGISTILLVCIITITRVNLVAMLASSATDTTTMKNMVFLFFAVLQMYMLVSRAFFGASLGEWAFELQLGTGGQQRSIYYPLQVLWRTFFTTMTGLFALPLLSFAFRRDLGRYISGLQLYRRA